MFFLIASNFMFAQNDWNFGARAGINLLPVPKDEVMGRQNYTGFNGGLFVSKRVYKKLALKVELNYTGKAKQYSYSEKASLLSSFGNILGGLVNNSTISSVTQYVNDTVYSNYKGVDKLGFIEIPVILTYNVKQFDFGIGGYTSFLITAKSKQELTQSSSFYNLLQPVIDSLGFAGTLLNGVIDGTYPGLKAPVITESTSKDMFVKVDYGMIADITYHYAPNLFFNLRYQYGFPNYRISPLQKPDNYTSFTFSFGYQFGWTRRKSSKSII